MEKIERIRKIEILKSEYGKIVSRYPFDEASYTETETSFVFDEKSHFEGFLFGAGKPDLYICAKYECLTKKELRIVPVSAFFYDCPKLVPCQVERFNGKRDASYLELSWWAEEHSTSRDADGVLYCDDNFFFFTSFGVFWPGQEQPRGIGYNSKTASLYDEKKNLVGWYVFAESKEDVEVILENIK